MKFICNFVFIVSFLLNFTIDAKAEGNRVIKIATGNKKALAYPILSSMCNLFNQKNLDKKLSCQVVETGGSEDNLSGLISKKYEAGVLKADMEYNAYNGIGTYFGKPYRELRTMFGLYNEYLTIVVKNNSSISGLKDFKNKRIYIGNKGSGSRTMVDKLFAATGWKDQDFKELHEEQADKIYDLFCSNQIDAAIYLVGHPNSIFTKTLKECDTKLISFSRKEIENYIDLFRYIVPSVIKKRTYVNQNYDVQTIASQLLLATSSDVDEKIIYDFVKTISENYKELQNRNPALRGASLFSSESAIIPLHRGSARYYENSK
jgi:TRAP transporter TAXI family solute receptor